MSQTKNDPMELWQQTLAKMQGSSADFWQANAAYWQTVSAIMGARVNTLAAFYQALPQQMQTLGQTPSFPELVAELTRWQQQLGKAAWNLNVDTQHQRDHLMEEWQNLAKRNGFGNQTPEPEKPAAKSSYYAANPHLAQPAKAAAPQAAAPAPQPTKPQAAAPVAASHYTPQAPGIFIPGPGHTTAAAEKSTENAEPNGHKPEPARNAAQAATLAGATSARRSVVASHRSRASRRSH